MRITIRFWLLLIGLTAMSLSYSKFYSCFSECKSARFECSRKMQSF